jgi:hypothetical protein
MQDHTKVLKGGEHALVYKSSKDAFKYYGEMEAQELQTKLKQDVLEKNKLATKKAEQELAWIHGQSPYQNDGGKVEGIEEKGEEGSESGDDFRGSLGQTPAAFASGNGKASGDANGVTSLALDKVEEVSPEKLNKFA